MSHLSRESSCLTSNTYICSKSAFTFLTAHVTVPLPPPRFLLLQSLDAMAKKADLDLNLFKSGGAPPPAVAEKSEK